MNETTHKTLEDVVEHCGRYPLEAFEFVRAGLNYTVQRFHGDTAKLSERECHVSGQQLCTGLREYALLRFGLMARVVLAHWRIVRTQDFGRIVFAMVEGKLMQKTENDDIHDFEEVYDFTTAFEPPPRPSKTGNTVFVL